jgi:hypothetical protein
MAIATRRTSLILVCAAILMTGCAKPQPAPKIKVLSEQEASDLWNKAEKREPVGDPIVTTVQGDTGTTVTSSQAYMLRGPGGGGGGLVTVCGGSCTVSAGGTLSGCQTSGCMPAGNSCTPLVCSGSCKTSSQCKAESHFGIFGGFGEYIE